MNSKLTLPTVALTLVLSLAPAWSGTTVFGNEVTLIAARDNTLFEYDWTDTDSELASNGQGDFFSAGRTRSRGLIRRGLLYFDLSELPTSAVVDPGSVRLTLDVVDAPRRDTSGQDRDFWMVPLEWDWGEGSSEANVGVSGAGSGAPATAGDATWLHSAFDSTIHDPRNPSFDPADGYWPAPGILGADPIDPTSLGEAAGTVPAAPYTGPVTFSANSLEIHLNAWLADPTRNFGWLVIGDERVVDAEASSNRGFASHEDPLRAPRLSFSYSLTMAISGDFDNDRQLTVVDLNQLTQAIAGMTGASIFDLNQDGTIDSNDRLMWVTELKRTYFGDSNLDGEFNSGDLVMVFQAGEYEDGLVENSLWQTGDWNGDLEFNTGDLVFAFGEGGYDQGPRAARVVPEPVSAICWLSAGMIVSGLARSRPNQRTTE